MVATSRNTAIHTSNLSSLISQLIPVLDSPSQLLPITKALKNLVIGNQQYKSNLINTPNAVSLLSQLASSSSPDIRLQAVVILSSLTISSHSDTLIQLGLPNTLLSCLNDHSNLVIVEAATRGLKTLYSTCKQAKVDLYNETHIATLIQLVCMGCPKHPHLQSLPTLAYPLDHIMSEDPQHPILTISVRIAQNAAHILALTCDSVQQQHLAAQCGGLYAGLCMLVKQPELPLGLSCKNLTAAMDLLSALCRDNVSLAEQVVHAKIMDQSALSLILDYLQHKDVEVRLTAATAITHLYRSKVLNEESDSSSRMALATLARLLQCGNSASIQERACLCFATLVSDSEPLQKLASESEALSCMVTVVQTALTLPITTPISSTSSIPSIPGMPLPTSAFAKVGHKRDRDRLAEAGLLAIAAGCSQTENARKIVVDMHLMSNIALALTHSQRGIRAAAGQAARSISRSVKAVRTAILDAKIAEPLVNLLEDSSPLVVMAATAALCNLVLDFAPMKETILKCGGIDKLARLITSQDPEIRHHATWALKNLAYKADPATKTSIIQAITWDLLRALVELDTSITVQEQALNLVRNLACGHDEDVEVVFLGYGQDALFGMLAEKLSCPHTDLVYQAVYTLVNIATGNETHKCALMSHDLIMQHLLALMSHSQSNIRVASVWTLINLTWPDQDLPSQRITKLQALGFEKMLNSMREDVDPDVRDRVSAALQQFHHDS